MEGYNFKGSTPGGGLSTISNSNRQRQGQLDGTNIITEKQFEAPRQSTIQAKQEPAQYIFQSQQESAQNILPAQREASAGTNLNILQLTVARFIGTMKPGDGLKTPLALLNEFMGNGGGIVKDEVANQGSAHDPTFESFLQVRFGNQLLEGSGKGLNKKDAKHAAAKSILLNIGFMDSMMSFNPAPARVQSEVGPKLNDSDVAGNPVGDLNTLCMKIKFPLPLYEEVPQEVPNSGLFKCSCRLNSEVFDTGVGTTKKQAKKLAASKVLDKMHQWLQEPETAKALISGFLQDDLSKRLGSISISNVNSPPSVGSRNSEDFPDSTNPTKTLAEVMKWFQSRKGDKLHKLMSLTTRDFRESDHELILTEVAAEQHLKVEYQDFRPYLDDPEYKAVLCFIVGGCLQLFVGNGKSTVAARKQASFHALDYMRLAGRC